MKIPNFKKRIKKTDTEKEVSDKKGFTLLFAILVSVLVLAVGASMITIALKQVILSGAGRESQFAFYAANTGVECALYWDLKGPELIDGAINYVFPPPDEVQLSNLDDVKCAGGNIVDGIGFPGGQTYTSGGWDHNSSSNITTFTLAISNEIETNTSGILYCVKVTVQKEYEEDDVVTTITSQGLNSCDPDSDARAVQRGLVLQYKS